MNSRTISGTIHGKVIELTDDVGLPDGSPVEVTISSTANRLASAASPTAGLLADCDTAEDDQVLAEIEAARKLGSLRKEPV